MSAYITSFNWQKTVIRALETSVRASGLIITLNPRRTLYSCGHNLAPTLPGKV